MPDQLLIFVGAVFTLGGAVKGLIGLGLPTISMGLLVTMMPPAQAAAILILPSLATNVWQMLAGPALGVVVRRLWPMLLAVCAGTWAGLGLMTKVSAGLGAAFLGAALVAYAITGLMAWRLFVPKAWEPVLSPVVGAVTGLITAATGVFVIPAVPYLQAIGFEKEELVQALGLSFLVSTLALGVNVSIEGGWQSTMSWPALIALIAASVGQWIGQHARLRVSSTTFRTSFFIALLVLGIYLILRTVA